ncbi:phage tail protein [Cupriavidus sp. KB_39]|uniref:phage tail-collar fiber domain-containing protein n=1 Tax=Cupriavidus sp. KB_39 TaxID=3233036 RepID=UPI003F8EEA58
MTQKYFLLPTAAGEARIANAQALGIPFRLSQMGVGDGNGALPVPNRERTELANEKRRADLNSLAPDPANPGQFIAEQVIPADEGGWWIREAGLYDDSGVLCYYSNVPETYKPRLAEGAGRTQVIRLVIIVTGDVRVDLKVDPSIVLATRDHVDRSVSQAALRGACKAATRVATVDNLVTLSGLQIVDDVQLVEGDRILVKNQLVEGDNGIYLAAEGNWTRAPDADADEKVRSGMLVPVDEGALNCESLWQLTSLVPVTVSTTPLRFKRAGADYFAPLASPSFIGAPTAPTPAPGDSTARLATTAFVTAAVASATRTEIGRIVLETRTTVRAGYLKLNGVLLTRADYPELWAYAIASGAVVSDADWTDGSHGAFSTGDDETTFRIPDFRGEHLRMWDAGRGVDQSRTVGSWQASQNMSHTHVASASAAPDHSHSAWTDAQGWHGHHGWTHAAGNHNHGVGGGISVQPVGRWSYRDAGGTDSVMSGFAGNHMHEFNTEGAGTHSHHIGIGYGGSHHHTVTIQNAGGTEVRVRNVAVGAFIRAF